MTYSKLLYTRKEVAQMLSVSLRLVDYLIATDQLTSLTIRRRRLVSADALAQFARRKDAEVQ